MKEVMAVLLWEIEAIVVDINKPFKLVSGNYSPIYINCRRVISYPALMQLFTASAITLCRLNKIRMDVVAGGETAGIPFAAYVANSLSLPMVYVRKRGKGHGIANLVEGSLPKNAKVLLVEDLITDAGSKISFIEGIKGVGGIVKDVLVLFDRQQGGREALEKRGIRLLAITDLATVLPVGKEAKFLSDDHLLSVQNYLRDPFEWHRKHNLQYVGVQQ